MYAWCVRELDTDVLYSCYSNVPCFKPRRAAVIATSSSWMVSIHVYVYVYVCCLRFIMLSGAEADCGQGLMTDVQCGDVDHIYVTPQSR